LGRHLVEGCGFTGNTRDYYDPRNSYLDVVLARRTGIPITLALVTVEVGRRLGLAVAGVGMPGHFLVRAVDQPAFLDPFHGSAVLDERDVRDLFARLFRGGRPFSPRFLDPVGPRAVLSRMLTN